MNINLPATFENQTDASLVKSTLAGNREAFGQIVARYQSPICGLAYSACGDLARSEDLGQEVFLTAFRKLASLQEPSRFKAWLYGIARNLINNAFRKNARNPLSNAETLSAGEEPPAVGAEPAEKAMGKEETALLWSVLSGLPEIYRQPMVLFYRENESIRSVAEVLAISEETVRQRLSRGRGLLEDRVQSFVQNGLRGAKPSDGFAVAVIASLPALAAVTTAKGAVVGMAASNSAPGQATGFFAVLKGIAGFAGLVAIPATLGSYFGHKLGQDSAGSPGRRKSAAKFWRVFIGGLLALVLVPLLLTFVVTGCLKNETRAAFLSAMTTWLGLAYPFVVAALIFWAWLRRRKGSGDLSCTTVEPESREAEGLIARGTRRISRRFVLFTTLAAFGLLIFCFFDMRHNVGHLSSDQLRELINRTAPADLQVSVSESHYRSLWGESPETFRTFLVQEKTGGKKKAYWAPVQETNLALLAQKGIPCPVYIQGRDFEVLGTPGRFLPLLCSFILGIGGIFLLRSYLLAKQSVR